MPPKRKRYQRKRHVTLLLTEDQYMRFQFAAEARELSLQDWMRSVLGVASRAPRPHEGSIFDGGT